MVLDKIIDINDIYKEILHSDNGIILKWSKGRSSASYTTYMAVFEKRMFRNGQVASASLLFVIGADSMTCDIITSGGGKVAFDLSDSVNRNFYDKMIATLEKIGFTKDSQDEYMAAM
jgi:hypothetical protein